jgi:hypothetical protein
MATRTANELERLVEQLEKQPKPFPPDSLSKVAEAIAGIFRVQTDEVAVMAVVPQAKLLRFILPAQLREVGTIPLTSTSALAARTARERRADIVNNFASSRHASVFEGVPLGRRQGDAIQKMMSAPIVLENKLIGVVQISRKGSTTIESGPDFSQTDLKELQSLTPLLSRFLSLDWSS